MRQDNTRKEYTTHCLFGGARKQEVTSKGVKDRKPMLFSAQENGGDVIRSTRGLRGLNQLAALRLQVAIASQSLRDDAVIHHAVQPVAAKQNLRSRLRLQRIRMHSKFGTHSDGHGQHVTHGMRTQAALVDS